MLSEKIEQPKVKRSLDAAAFNRIASDPEVRPWLGFTDPAADVDLSAMVGNPDNFCFLTEAEDGGYILVKLQPGLYCAHTLSLKSARGRPMLNLMRDGFAMMFMATDAVEICTMVPDGAEQADKWSDLAGFRETFRRDAFFPIMGQRVGGSFRSLHYQDWVMRDPRHEGLGKLFHDKLDAARKAGEAETHADDKAHDQWVGATLGGCISGNLSKSIGMYNRWAAQSGYEQARIMTVNPPVVDIGDAIVGLALGRLDVLKIKPTRQALQLNA